MAEVPVQTKKAVPVPISDPFRSLRTEVDRLFDRFAAGLRMPSWRHMFEMEPIGLYGSSFSFPTPAVEVTEDDKMFKITAELPHRSRQNHRRTYQRRADHHLAEIGRGATAEEDDRYQDRSLTRPTVEVAGFTRHLQKACCRSRS